MTNLNERMEQLEAQEKAIRAEQREIYRKSLEAPEAEKVCPDGIAEMIGSSMDFTARHGEPEPFTVRRVTMGKSRALTSEGCLREVGSFVAIRPCAEECENRTFLGLYIGDLALSVMTHISRDIDAIKLDFSMHNPAIWVFELNRIVLGCESWWGPIKDEKHLRKITNDDIDNAWYVRALRQMTGEKQESVPNSNRCLLCGTEITFPSEHTPWEPHLATVWNTTGGAGSAELDAMEDEHFEAYICDDCLRSHKARFTTVVPGALRMDNKRFPGIVDPGIVDPRSEAENG